MAKAKKHEMTKEELRAPADFEVKLHGVWEKLFEHRKLLYIGVGALVAIGIAAWVVGAVRRSGVEDRSVALREASQAIGGGVGPLTDPLLKDLPAAPRFDDEAARAKASQEKLAAYLGAHAGDGGATLAQIAAAQLKLDQGDAAGALAGADAWLSANEKSPVKPMVLMLKARAEEAVGKNDAAVATLKTLSGAAEGPLKAEALARLGDLHNPLFQSGAGDAAQAKASYEAALAALPPDVAEPNPFMMGGKPGLRGWLENRLEILP